MAYCSGCGSQIPEFANFCGGCGRSVGGAASTAAAVPVAAPEPLDYTIVGDNLQIVRAHLKAGQEVYAEAGKMIYKTANVDWDTRMTGQTLGQKLLGALRRTVTGESLFVTFF